MPKSDGWFKKGVSGNPGGKIKGLITSQHVQACISKYLAMTKEELEECVKDPKTSTIDLAIASTLVQCIKLGDFTRMEMLLNRAVGRVKDQLEIQVPKPYVIERRDGGRLELGASIEEKEDV